MPDQPKQPSSLGYAPLEEALFPNKAGYRTITSHRSYHGKLRQTSYTSHVNVEVPPIIHLLTPLTVSPYPLPPVPVSYPFSPILLLSDIIEWTLSTATLNHAP